jgi:hypothetical protein
VGIDTAAVHVDTAAGEVIPSAAKADTAAVHVDTAAVSVRRGAWVVISSTVNLAK